MPDKAIDLVDEACANVRVQLDSVPEDIDVLRRQKYRLEVEEKAISKEKDKARPPIAQRLTLQPKLHVYSNRHKPAPYDFPNAVAPSAERLKQGNILHVPCFCYVFFATQVWHS